MHRTHRQSALWSVSYRGGGWSQRGSFGFHSSIVTTTTKSTSFISQLNSSIKCSICTFHHNSSHCVWRHIASHDICTPNDDYQYFNMSKTSYPTIKVLKLCCLDLHKLVECSPKQPNQNLSLYSIVWTCSIVPFIYFVDWFLNNLPTYRIQSHSLQEPVRKRVYAYIISKLQTITYWTVTESCKRSTPRLRTNSSSELKAPSKIAKSFWRSVKFYRLWFGPNTYINRYQHWHCITATDNWSRRIDVSTYRAESAWWVRWKWSHMGVLYLSKRTEFKRSRASSDRISEAFLEWSTISMWKGLRPTRTFQN